MKNRLFAFGILAVCAAFGETWQLSSPDGSLAFALSADGDLGYSLVRNGRTLIEKSELGFAFAGEFFRFDEDLRAFLFAGAEVLLPLRGGFFVARRCLPREFDRSGEFREGGDALGDRFFGAVRVKQRHARKA